MGIEIHIVSHLPRTGIARRVINRDRLHRRIMEAITASLGSGLLSRYLHLGVHEHTLLAAYHPAAPPLMFTWDPSGQVFASVKTSTVGPGFHAQVVELLDDVATRCGLSWRWNDCSNGDYAISRNFEALQRECAAALGLLAHAILQHAGTASCTRALHWDLRTPMPQTTAFSISPNGVWSREWWEELARADAVELKLRARDFYPWWNKRQDAGFYLGFGKTLLWSEVPWHAPANNEEVDICRLALDACSTAKTLDARIELPAEELNELALLIAPACDRARRPSAGGIGFRRGPVRIHTTGGWSIVLPGYFYAEGDQENIGVMYSFPGVTVNMSSATVGGAAGDPSAARRVVTDLVTIGTDDEDAFEFQQEQLIGRALIASVDTDIRGGRYLDGRLASGSDVCHASIWYDDPSDRLWAIDTFKSIRHHRRPDN